MLNDANVVVYPVDARGLMTSQGPTPVNIPSAPGAPANNFSQAPPGAGDVRYRKGYLASAQEALTEKQRAERMRTLFANPLDASAIGLTAHFVAGQSREDQSRVAFTVDLHDVRLDWKDGFWAGSVAVGLALESARPLTLSMTTLPIRIPDQQFKAALRDGLTIQQPVETRVKNDRPRVAVQDESTGATGSLWVPLGAR